jgi:hypothetical protein
LVKVAREAVWLAKPWGTLVLSYLIYFIYFI